VERNVSEGLREETHPGEDLGRLPVPLDVSGARRTPTPRPPSTDEGLHTLTAALSVWRGGPRAWVRVGGQLNALTRRHLDDWLDWLITNGAEHVTVSLANAAQIDDDCLSVLRMARARLRSRDGELLVTAGLAQAPDEVTETTGRGCRVGRHPHPSTSPDGQPHGNTITSAST
jgi:anti-anti-sigma regulatory factor